MARKGYGVMVGESERDHIVKAKGKVSKETAA